MSNLAPEATAFFKLEGGDESGGTEKLRRVLDGLDGVLEVRVNFIIDTISVRYDSDRLTRDEIKKKVDQSNRVSKGR
jgi:copper chaperone CopZ